MYLNKVILYGNLTRDPEVKALPSGGQVASFGIATNRAWKDKAGAKQEATEFHNIVAFGRQAEVIAQYVQKGRALYIEGRVQTRSWDKDGVKQYRTEIIVEQFQFGADNGASSPQRKAAPKVQAVATADPLASEFDDTINPEDIPF